MDLFFFKNIKVHVVLFFFFKIFVVVQIKLIPPPVILAAPEVIVIYWGVFFLFSAVTLQLSKEIKGGNKYKIFGLKEEQRDTIGPWNMEGDVPSPNPSKT